jgi:hypothetical protein
VAGSHRGIYISESHDTDVFGNTIRRTDRAIALFQDGNRISESELGHNYIHGNTIEVPSTSILPGVGTLAAAINCTNLTTSQCSAYSTSRGNRFDGNHYVLPSETGRWWAWDNESRTWADWRAQGQDVTGTATTGGA